MRTKNAMQLKAIIRNRAKEEGVPPQMVMQNYLLERLLERISLSPWRKNVVIKGGIRYRHAGPLGDIRPQVSLRRRHIAAGSMRYGRRDHGGHRLVGSIYESISPIRSKMGN